MAGEKPLTFAALLRQYRVAARLTQEALAEQAGLSARGLSDLERGVRRGPYRDTIQRLAEALHLSSVERSALAAAGRRESPLAAVARVGGRASPGLPLPGLSHPGDGPQ